MNMNHFGGMKREREDDDEVNAKSLAKHQINQSLTILSTWALLRVTPVKKNWEDFNLKEMAQKQARRPRAG